MVYPAMVMVSKKYALIVLVLLHGACAFLAPPLLPPQQRRVGRVPAEKSVVASRSAGFYLKLSSSSASEESFDSSQKATSPLSSLVTARLPTSVEDQVRQCVSSLQAASSSASNNDDDAGAVVCHRRHLIRLLLPVIGSTELDDWPGGARQMMEAASPLVEQIIAGLFHGGNTKDAVIQKVCLDASDGVYAWIAQGPTPADDCVFVLLPTAECVSAAILTLDTQQVGPKRNLILINPQWRRRSDFGGFFGSVDEKTVSYIEGYQPTFFLSNFICEGESIRVLRTTTTTIADAADATATTATTTTTLNSDDWRVYCRRQLDNGDVDWDLVGTKPFVAVKPADWQQQPGNNRDGGRLFDYGQPSYQDIIDMLNSSSNYTPKNPAERAAAAFDFIKDTL